MLKREHLSRICYGLLNVHVFLWPQMIFPAKMDPLQFFFESTKKVLIFSSILRSLTQAQDLYESQ
jgi:hypothetical protein